MELHANYTIDYLTDFIGDAAQRRESAVIFLRSSGWNNSTNVDAINASMNRYKSALSLDVWTALHQSEFSFIICDNVREAMEWCESVFPDSLQQCAIPEDYIFYAVYGPNGQILASNE
jgi:hypothetical protein